MAGECLQKYFTWKNSTTSMSWKGQLIELVGCFPFVSKFLPLLWITLESKIITGVFSKDPWASFTNKSGIWILFLCSRSNLDQPLRGWSFKDMTPLRMSQNKHLSKKPPELNELLWKTDIVQLLITLSHWVKDLQFYVTHKCIYPGLKWDLCMYVDPVLLEQSKVSPEAFGL